MSVTRTVWNRLKKRLPPRTLSSIEMLLAHNHPGRELDVLPDDTFVVSYPKSGNTWVRFLVANLLHEDATDFVSLQTRIPAIYRSTVKELALMPRPRILKSHEYFDPRYPRVVYVVRDPRDVLVSYYHYSLRKGFIQENHSIEAFGDDFIHGRLDKFGTWFENTASWLAAREGSPDFLVVRYEDLRRDPVPNLVKIAQLLGVEPTDSTISRAVESSSFDQMKRLERLSRNDAVHLHNKRADIPFVRKGIAGGWRQELPDSVRLAVESAWEPLMRQLRYLDDEQRSHTGQ